MANIVFLLCPPRSPLPSDAFLIGYTLPKACVVVSLQPTSTRREDLDLGLAAIPPTSGGLRISILGILHAPGDPRDPQGERPGENVSAWIHLDSTPSGTPSHPLLRIILYDPPNPSKHHFLALSPLKLDVSSNSISSSGGDRLLGAVMEANEEGSCLSNVRASQRGADGSFRAAIQLMNQACLLDQNLRRRLAGLTPASSPETKQFQVLSSWWSRVTAALSPSHSGPVWLLRLLRTPLPLGIPLLKDLSASVNQIDVRAEQAVFLPTQLPILKASNDLNTAVSRARYINFYNNVWLILNDIIVGRSLGTVLCETNVTVADELSRVITAYTIRLPVETLEWLNAWPGGLKLNTELSAFISSAFLALISVWEQAVLQPILHHLPTILILIGASGILGATMLLSMLSDLLSLLTGHLYIAYLLATWSFRSFKTVLGTLFNVFRGKRVNVLRNRVDSVEYSVDQLLLGSILFTLFSFLFPTVVVYYLAISLSRFVIIFGHALFETCLAFMNHFPLFAVLLRAKDPARLPGGVEIDVSQQHPGVLVLQSRPIPMARIFFQHFVLVGRLSAHYSPIRLLKCLWVGETIQPIERFRLRYSSVL